jgi:hypothetical protein
MFKIKNLFFKKNNSKKIDDDQKIKEEFVNLGFNIAKNYSDKDINTIKLVDNIPIGIYYPIVSHQILSRGEAKLSDHKIINRHVTEYCEVTRTLYVKDQCL